MTTSLRRLAAAVAATAALFVAVAPAAAHEGDGTLEVVAAAPAAPLQVSYQVRLTFEADGHPAADATVTVVAERPGVAPTTPQPMTAAGEEGVYTETVTFPDAGDWTVRFTAVTPPATLERTETVAPPPTTTTNTTTPTTTTTIVDNTDDADDGSSNALFIAGGVVLAAVLVGGAIMLARRRR